MPFGFRIADIKKIGKLLGVTPRESGSMYRFEIGGKDGRSKLALEMYPNIRIGEKHGSLISVYTETAHLQLHFCSGYVISEMLGEVTFVGEEAGKLSGLIIEKQGGCSLYANVDRKLLSGDFTQLGPEVMLSGIALSLTDGILEKPATTRKARGGAKRKASLR
jgi:hypothetical protein